MIKIWAVIKDGVVVNVVLASDEDIKDPQYIWVDVTNLDPRPGPGWLYDGSLFSRLDS